MDTVSKFNKRDDCEEKDIDLLALQDYLDGEATLEQIQYFKTHLQQCNVCNKKFLEEKKLKDLVKSQLSPRKIPSKLVHQITSKLFQHKETT